MNFVVVVDFDSETYPNFSDLVEARAYARFLARMRFYSYVSVKEVKTGRLIYECTFERKLLSRYYTYRLKGVI